ncbi:MAG: peptidase [Planctomycetota bacterium]
MPFSPRLLATPLIWFVAALLSLPMGSQASRAAHILLKDGRILSGKEAPVSSLVQKAPPASGDDNAPLQLIVMVDDDLRRTFVSKRQIQDLRPDSAGQSDEKFRLIQQVLSQGPTVKSVGRATRIQPFDEYGRRTFSFPTSKGEANVIQAITELTPRYAKVEGMTHVWDMRVATSSIPRDVLHKILLHQINPDDIEHLKKIARFYIQAERYEEAQAQLQAITAKFDNAPEVQKQLEPTIRSLRQIGAQRLLTELQLRRRAGQHQLVYSKLQQFPTEDVAGEILQAVRENLADYQGLEERRRESLKYYDELLAQVQDTALRAQLAEVGKEIAAELGIDTIARMAPFRQNVNDQEMLPQERLSLAVSGWLLGPNSATVNVRVALSAYKVRGLLRRYLSASDKAERDDIFALIQSEEAASPPVVAPLFEHMKPPVDLPAPLDAEKQPGMYRVEIPGLPKEPPIEYFVQLPPEYSPYHSYPTVVTLNGSGTTPAEQIDWWAGAWTPEGWRAGQATRQGYIVIAPNWSVEHQKQYGYSPREHYKVLACLRDACQRFAVDTDRVFLSGHSMGGDAAWDIALAHPDLWAGAIPIVAQADKYVTLYWPNAKLVPLYFVCGEMDGGKIAANSTDFDRYLKLGFNCTVVEYQGRGHENFSDEILRIFDWMGRCQRNFFPREFTVKTLRPSDSFFWWLELEGMPPGAVVEFDRWPLPRGTQPVQVEAQVTKSNGLYISTGTSRVSVWVSPKMVDFGQRVNITVNGRRVNSADRFVQPDLLTLIEDVRTRGDRHNPFWAKIDAATGRVAGAR